MRKHGSQCLVSNIIINYELNCIHCGFNNYIFFFFVTVVLGIKIGEIGGKLGMNSTNNGFLAFNNVRIPRMNMLMKNAQVLKVLYILV